MSLFSIAAKFALKGASKRVPEDIMSGTIRRIKQEAQLPEFKREAWWKDAKRVKKGLESVDTSKYKEVDETIDTLSALGKDKTDIDLYRKPIKEGGQKLPQKQSDLTKSEELEEAARTLQDRGSIYQETFKEIRDRVKPKRTYGTVPAVKTEFDIAASLPGKSYERGIIGVNRNLKQGEEVGARFDINAYNWFNTYVATITKKVKGVDKVFGYGPTAVLRDVKFDMVGPEAFKVAQGAGKKPFARFYGKWQDMNPKAAQQKAIDNIKSKEWVEVGFDPSGRGGFYRRDTGDVVGAAEEVIQVGPMLLAKGLKVPTKEQLKKLVVKTNVDSIVFDNKHGGQVSEGLSSIVSRANGGKADKRWNFATPGKLEWQERLDRHADRLLEDEERRYSGQEPRTLNPDFYSDEARTFNNPVYDLFGDPTEWFGNKEKTLQEYYQELKDVLGYVPEESERQWNLAGQGFKRIQDSQGRRLHTLDGAAIDTFPEVARTKNVAPVRSTSSPQTDHTLSGLEGYSEVTDPSSGVTTSFIDDVAIDTISGLKHGGQPMAGGLSGIKKTININGQPHSLAWINPSEASVLKAMGGSGKKVEGVPAYYYDDPGSMQSYLDEADAADVLDPITEEKAIASEVATRYLTDDGGTTTDRSEATGLTSPVTFMNLEEADLTSEEGAGLGKIYRQYIQDKIKQLREGREGEGREYEKALALEAIQAEIPGSTDPWDLEKFAKDYPAIAPLGWAAKGLGWIASLDKNPVVSQVNMGGKIYDIHMDGTMTERKDEDYGDDGPDPIKKKKKLLPRPVASAAPVEKELTGMEKYYSELPKTTPRKASNVHLSALLDQIYGEGQGQKLLG